MSKYREYWLSIGKWSDQPTTAKNHSDFAIPSDFEKVHVIEIKAYEEAIKALKTIYESAGPCFDPDMDHNANTALTTLKKLNEL